LYFVIDIVNVVNKSLKANIENDKSCRKHKKYTVTNNKHPNTKISKYYIKYQMENKN